MYTGRSDIPKYVMDKSGSCKSSYVVIGSPINNNKYAKLLKELNEISNEYDSEDSN